MDVPSSRDQHVKPLRRTVRNGPSAADHARRIEAPNSASQDCMDQDVSRPLHALTLDHYLRVIKHHAWLIVGAVGLCVAATILISGLVTPMYESTAVIDIEPPDGTADRDPFFRTQTSVLQSDLVLRAAGTQNGGASTTANTKGVAESKITDSARNLIITHT